MTIPGLALLALLVIFSFAIVQIYGIKSYLMLLATGAAIVLFFAFI